jgi:hypothetical protein
VFSTEGLLLDDAVTARQISPQLFRRSFVVQPGMVSQKRRDLGALVKLHDSGAFTDSMRLMLLGSLPNLKDPKVGLGGVVGLLLIVFSIYSSTLRYKSSILLHSYFGNLPNLKDPKVGFECDHLDFLVFIFPRLLDLLFRSAPFD